MEHGSLPKSPVRAARPGLKPSHNETLFSMPPLQGSDRSSNLFQGLTPLAISSRPFGAPELMPWLKGWPERNKEKEVIRLGYEGTLARTYQN